jgi:hypothetical protein
MEKIRRYNVTMIRRSCITGKIVWVYRGMSKNAGWVAYHRVCKKELERVKHLPEMEAEYKAQILKLLNDCMANLPINAELTPDQKAAAKKLLKMADEMPPYDMEFYNHIVEERRRREEDKRIRQKMREREAAEKAAIKLGQSSSLEMPSESRLDEGVKAAREKSANRDYGK